MFPVVFSIRRTLDFKALRVGEELILEAGALLPKSGSAWDKGTWKVKKGLEEEDNFFFQVYITFS